MSRTRGNYGIVGSAQTVTATSTGIMVSAVDQQLLKSAGNWLGAPGAPTNVTALASSGSATVSFNAPTNTGGLTITGYTVTSNPGGIVATGTTSPITVNGLTNGTSYTFTVTATNSYGTSPSSTASNSVTPLVFAGAYATLISSFAGTKIYVDIVNGSDTANNGLSSATPFATITKALTYRDTLTGGTYAIIVYPGTYTMSPYYINGGNVSAGIADVNPSGSNQKPTTFICAPGKVIISFTSDATARDGPAVFQNGTTSGVYGAIIKRNNNGKATNYSTAFFAGTWGGGYGVYYNCVFQETNANNNWSILYDNNSSASATVNNCSFYVSAAGLGDYSGGTSFSIINCAFNYTYSTTVTTNTNSYILSSHNMNSTTYVSPGATNQGVYYGTYAWY